MSDLIFLGIESSCDETAIGIVRAYQKKDEAGKMAMKGEILANIISSQINLHAEHGGVVPEIAARAHIDKIDDLMVRALRQAQLKKTDLSAIAATAGPGLIGGVMVGLVYAKALAIALNKPFLAINHLEAHALSAQLSHALDFPFLLLLISGGHSALISVKGLGQYKEWGKTRDDAIGEAFDKTARLLKLDWASGAQLEKLARSGDGDFFDLPRPFLGAPHADFSFSGLKTATRRLMEEEGFQHNHTHYAHIAASFQQACADCLSDRTRFALKQHQLLTAPEPCRLVVAGGVAANQTIRQKLKATAQDYGAEFIAPPPILCTDNGAMIAWAGACHFINGRRDDLSAAPRARWPLTSSSSSPSTSPSTS